MSRISAMRVYRHAAELRSNLSLMRRSRAISGPDYADAVRSSCLFLAHNDLIYPPAMLRVGLRPGMSLSERKQVLRLPEPAPLSPAEQLFQAFLETSQRKARKSVWMWRIGQECMQSQRDGWYGFFVTLTVDPSRVPDSQAMWEEGREFRKYIRRLARVSAAASGFSNAIKDGVSCRQFVRHVGVIEHGSSRHHHHLHMLVWMRGIPEAWKADPNAGISDPRRRTNDWCRPLSAFWPHALPGLGRAKYFRHEGDIWSRMGFVLPWDAKRGRTVRIAPAFMAGLYVGKYMDKDDKVWLHRVKASRGLGLTLLRQTLMEMAVPRLRALTWRPRSFDLNSSIPTIHNVPNVLLRSLAKQELFCRQWANGTLDYPSLVLESTGPYSAMLKSVRDGAMPHRMSSKELFDWLTGFLPVPEGYCETRLAMAWHELGVNFPPNLYCNNTHIGIT